MTKTQSRIARVASFVVLTVMVSTAASAYVLLSPARRWFSTPRLVRVDQTGLNSISGPDPDRGVTAAVNAVKAWNTSVGGPTLSVTNAQSAAVAYVLGDGISDLKFGDPLNICKGSCIAATTTGFFNAGQTGTCSYAGGGSLAVVAVTDADIAFNLRFKYTTASEDPPGSGTCSNEIFLEAVTTHEVGHLIGLAHSAVSAALMAPTVSFCVNKPLNSDDTLGRNALYNCATFP